jgi:oligopeptide transport system ATP-binding protein
MEQPPMFRISDTHYAATWLLDPKAPVVSPPDEILRRQQIFERLLEAGEVLQ